MKSWPTPDASNHRDGAVLRTDNNLEQGGFHGVSLHHAMTKYGQAAPASSSSLGSRQGLWPTITAHTPDMESNGPNGHTGTYLAGAVKQQARQWATPRSGKTTDENPETWALRQAKGDVATMPLTAQVKAWATPIMGDSHLASTPEVAKKRIEEGKVTLSRQMAAQWGTPTARDHKSGRGNEEREYKELTPMVERTQTGKLNPRWVETLMGLPVGWVMPSCVSPVTIARTSCDSSATESSPQPPSELF
jgi:hypothetical protein